MGLSKEAKKELKVLRAKKKTDGGLDTTEKKRLKVLRAELKTDGDAADSKRKRDEPSDAAGESKADAAPACSEKKSKKSKKDKQKKKKKAAGGGESKVAGTSGTSGSTASAASPETLAYRESNKIKLFDPRGGDYEPCLSFVQAATMFPAAVLDASCKGFKDPSPVQSQSWPIALDGRDIVSIAKTGSGKTLAFVLPGIVHILACIKRDGGKGKTRSLVVAPTRELAQQSAVVFAKAGMAVNLKCTCIYGGVPKWQQRKDLQAGCDIIVSTPGRLLDLVEEGHCDLSQVSFMILDEADRMLDLGFEKDIKRIISLAKKDRQTLMYSATWPQSIQQIASEFLSDPVRVNIGSSDLSASDTIEQRVEVIDPMGRDRRLVSLLTEYNPKQEHRTIVFVLYKKEAVRVSQYLTRNGWPNESIHGDRGQTEREAAVEKFRAGTMRLLVATDVAARGLDIPDVNVVLNYSFPLTTEDYVHRIGRTGRAGKKGLAHTFFTVNDKARAGELQNVLRKANVPIPPELLKFGSTVKKKVHPLYGAHYKEGDETKKATKVTFDSDSD